MGKLIWKLFFSTFLLSLCSAVYAQQPPQPRNKNLTLLWLFTLEGSATGAGRIPAGRLALEDIDHSADILPGYQLVALERDTQFYDRQDMKITLGALVRAIYDAPAQQLFMIIGPTYTTEARAVAQLTPNYNLINIAGLATSPILSDKKTYPLFFRASQSDGDFKYAIQAILEKFNYTNIIGLYLDDQFALDSALVFERYLQNHDTFVELSNVFRYEDTRDLVIKNMRKVKTRVILAVFNGQDGRQLICQLYQQLGINSEHFLWILVGVTQPEVQQPRPDDNPKCTVRDMDRALNGSLWLVYGGLDPDDRVMVTGYRPSELSARMRTYVAQHFPHDTSGIIDLVYREYDAFISAAVALNNSIQVLRARNMSLDDFNYSRADMTKVFQQELLKLDIEGAAGPIRFQANGDRYATISLLQYQPPAALLATTAESTGGTASGASHWIQVGQQVYTTKNGTTTGQLVFTRPLIFGTRDGLQPEGVEIIGILQQPLYVALIVIAAFLMLLVLPGLLIGFFLYRRHQRLVAIRNMQWIIDPTQVTLIGDRTKSVLQSFVSMSAAGTSLADVGGGGAAGSRRFSVFTGNETGIFTEQPFLIAAYQQSRVCLFPLLNFVSSALSTTATATTSVPNSKSIETSLRQDSTLITQVKAAQDCRHENVARFVGLLFDAQFGGGAIMANDWLNSNGRDENVACQHYAAYEWFGKGTLRDCFASQTLDLNLQFQFSIMRDVCFGLEYIHRRVGHHGRLSSFNVIVDLRFSCKLANFGLDVVQSQYLKFCKEEELLWTAPELLQAILARAAEKKIAANGFTASATHTPSRSMAPSSANEAALQKADVYSVGIICAELITRELPFEAAVTGRECSVREILEELVATAINKNSNANELVNNSHNLAPFPAATLDSTNSEKASILPHDAISLFVRCANYCAQERPTASETVETLRRIMRNHGMSDNIMENLLKRLEQYAQNLETLVQEKTQAFFDEKMRAETLLYNILPRSVADQLKNGKAVEPESFECVTIYFSDVVGFTALSAQSTPIQIIDLLNDLYNMFDGIIADYDVYKVETIGDAYMVVSGLPNRNGDEHARQIARMSQHLMRDMQRQFRVRHKPEYLLNLRIGLHSGACAAGVVGFVMPRYCLFGDTVNTASRMESTGEPMRIHVSESTQVLLTKFQLPAIVGKAETEEESSEPFTPEFTFEPRGEVAVKGKGVMSTFFLQI